MHTYGGLSNKPKTQQLSHEDRHTLKKFIKHTTIGLVRKLTAYSTIQAQQHIETMSYLINKLF